MNNAIFTVVDTSAVMLGNSLFSNIYSFAISGFWVCQSVAC